MHTTDTSPQVYSGRAYVHLAPDKMNICNSLARLLSFLGFKAAPDPIPQLITSKVNVMKEKPRLIGTRIQTMPRRENTMPMRRTALYNFHVPRPVLAVNTDSDFASVKVDGGEDKKFNTPTSALNDCTDQPNGHEMPLHPETVSHIDDLLRALKHKELRTSSRVHDQSQAPTEAGRLPTVPEKDNDVEPVATTTITTSARNDVPEADPVQTLHKLNHPRYDHVPTARHPRPRTRATSGSQSTIPERRVKHTLRCGHAVRGSLPTPCRGNCTCYLHSSPNCRAGTATGKQFACCACSRTRIATALDAAIAHLGFAENERETVIQAWREGKLTTDVADVKIERLVKTEDRIRRGTVKVATSRQLQIVAQAAVNRETGSEKDQEKPAILMAVEEERPETMLSEYRGVQRGRGLVDLRNLGM